MEAVSFVVPVRNGAACIRETVESILAQADGRPMEVILVDDGSDDESSMVLRRLAKLWPLTIVAGEGRGAAAAINKGLRAARHPIICQVDQDVVLAAGWMRLLTQALEDPTVAAAQGYYTADAGASLCARAMNLDLEYRYAAIEGTDTDQACTGNSAYRAGALRQVGLFDEGLGYGYDNDVSYRLRAAGYRLTLCRDARAMHRWREGFASYLIQQYGFGYGRIDLVAKHPGRVTGDAVSPFMMMLHPVAMAVAMVSLIASGFIASFGGPWRGVVTLAAALVAGLALERLVAGIGAARRFRTPVPLVFPLLHLGRDLAWVAAIAMWSARSAFGIASRPAYSMRARTGSMMRPALRRLAEPGPVRSQRTLCLIPAHNEVDSLRAAVEDVRTCQPDIDVLVIDDGSTDGTAAVLEGLDVRWLHFPERMGIGAAMRAGLRYATRFGYDAVVRVDGDGQHRADDIDRLLAPVRDGRADVVLGSRYASPDTDQRGMTRLAQRFLAVCLSALTRGRVTDPTSGFCVVGPRALRVLAEHHPTGYPEPELRLFLNRNALSVVEVPIRARSRMGGRTSLTAARMAGAVARTLLAMVVVPLRRRVGEPAGD